MSLFFWLIIFLFFYWVVFKAAYKLGIKHGTDREKLRQLERFDNEARSKT